MYLNDFKFIFPQPSHDSQIEAVTNSATADRACWFNAVDGYYPLANQTYTSAANRNYPIYKQDPIYATFGETPGGNGSRTFKMNQYFGDCTTTPQTATGIRWTEDSDVKIPANTVIIFDGMSRDLGTPNMSISSSYNTAFHGGEERIGLRHSDGANVLFVDGHAATKKQDTVADTVGSVDYRRWYLPNEDAGHVRQKFIWDFRNW